MSPPILDNPAAAAVAPALDRVAQHEDRRAVGTMRDVEQGSNGLCGLAAVLFPYTLGGGVERVDDDERVAVEGKRPPRGGVDEGRDVIACHHLERGEVRSTPGAQPATDLALRVVAIQEEDRVTAPR